MASVPPITDTTPSPVKLAFWFSVKVPPENSTADPAAMSKLPELLPPSENRSVPSVTSTGLLSMNGVSMVVMPLWLFFLNVPLFTNDDPENPRIERA